MSPINQCGNYCKHKIINILTDDIKTALVVADQHIWLLGEKILARTHNNLKPKHGEVRPPQPYDAPERTE